LVEAARIPWRPLGRLLVEQGLLSDDELERALEAQASTGQRLGETIVELGFVSHPALSRALAAQYGIELKGETGFGTGLRAEIERRHAREREDEIQPRLKMADTPPVLADVSQPEAPEVHAANVDELHLAQLEEQWAKLAAAEELLANAERELTAWRRAAAHRRNQAGRLVARIRRRDSRIVELSAAEELLANAERELTALRRAAAHRRNQAGRLVARIRRRDSRIVELSAADRGDLADLHEPRPSQGDDGSSLGHLIYAQLGGRYELIERDGAPPEPDAIVELTETGERVLVGWIGKSPLPNDARPCAVAQQVRACPPRCET
jgi:hypothetical protein